PAGGGRRSEAASRCRHSQVRHRGRGGLAVACNGRSFAPQLILSVGRQASLPMPEDRGFENKVVLIGLCYFDRAGALHRQDQCHGTIVRVSNDGLAVRLSSGSMLLLPPY